MKRYLVIADNGQDMTLWGILRDNGYSVGALLEEPPHVNDALLLSETRCRDIFKNAPVGMRRTGEVSMKAHIREKRRTAAPDFILEA